MSIKYTNKHNLIIIVDYSVASPVCDSSPCANDGSCTSMGHLIIPVSVQLATLDLPVRLTLRTVCL